MTSIPPRRRFLYLVRRSPHGTPAAREGLDLVLATAAFDHPVTLVFLEDGIYQLLTHQAPAGIGRADWTRAYGALADYGIEAVYVEGASLRARGLDVASLRIPVTVVEAHEIRALFDTHEVIAHV